MVSKIESKKKITKLRKTTLKILENISMDEKELKVVFDFLKILDKVIQEHDKRYLPD